MLNAREVAFFILKDVSFGQSYADIALSRGIDKSQLSQQDRALATELVYGVLRRQRTLDALIDQFAKKKAHQQPNDILLALRLGIYQLRYMDAIPNSAAVNTSVDLMKKSKYSKELSGVVNAILRKISINQDEDPLNLPNDNEMIARLGIFYSFPDWIIEFFLQQFDLDETQQLCSWFNQVPSLDIRINPLKNSRIEVQKLLEQEGIGSKILSKTQQGLRLQGSHGSIVKLPGYCQGLWSVQDASAQQVVHFLDPQPGEVIIDACAAPGGKSTHIAELIKDQGEVWAIDRIASRLKKLSDNAERLGLDRIKIVQGDNRQMSHFENSCDRLLLDVPCSGLGTLHRNLDLRWRLNQERIEQLFILQQQILSACQKWVKPQGILVYSTCTLNPKENEHMIESFLQENSDYSLLESLKLYPQRDDRDGFYMVKLQKK